MTLTCPTCEGTGKVHLLFGTCPLTPTMVGEIQKYLLSKTYFSKEEMEVLKDMLDIVRNHFQSYDQPLVNDGSGRLAAYGRPDSMSDDQWKEFLEKLQ